MVDTPSHTREVSSRLNAAICGVPHIRPRKVSGAEGNQQIAELVLQDPIAWLDDRGAVELLEDGRPLKRRIERQPVPGIDRRSLPAVDEPDAAFAGLRRLQRRG